MTSRAAGWPSDGPTAAQIKEFFAQIDNGSITKDRLQQFLRAKPLDPDLIYDIHYLKLPDGASFKALRGLGVMTIADLVKFSADELRAIPEVTPAFITTVKIALERHGLALADEASRASSGAVEDWPESDLRPYASLAYLDMLVSWLVDFCELLDCKIELLESKSFPISDESRAHWQPKFDEARELIQAIRGNFDDEIDRAHHRRGYSLPAS